MVKKPLSEELTCVIMSGGFFVVLFWLLGQKPSKKPLKILILR